MRNASVLVLALCAVMGSTGCVCLFGGASSECGCEGLGLGRGETVKSKAAVNPVSMASDAITPDGKLDEPAWKNAPALTDFIRGSDRPEVKTRALLTYDKDNLYVAVVCEEPNTDKLVTKATQRDEDQVWSDDCVEIYVDPTNDKQGTSGYYGFFVTPKNVVYDRTDDGNWSSDAWKHGANVVPGKGWVAEVAVPFKVMGVTPKAGHRLGLMVARIRKAGVSQYMTLVPCNNEAKDTTKYPVLELK